MENPRRNGWIAGTPISGNLYMYALQFLQTQPGKNFSAVKTQGRKSKLVIQTNFRQSIVTKSIWIHY